MTTEQTVPGGALTPGPEVRVDPTAAAPTWVAPVIRQTIWRVIWTVLGMTVLILMLLKARSLISMLVIAMFFGIAMDPAVTSLNRKRGWKRGAATALVFAVVVVFVVALITVLIPAIISVADTISAKLPGWISSAQDTFGIRIDGGSTAAAQLEEQIRAWAKDNAGRVLGIASSGVGLIFQFFTIAMFTFYFAADAPRIRRSILRRVPPGRQERLGWAWDTAITQTGGYFYSRLLLMIINGGLFFFVMLLVGVPWLIALPLAVFEGFVAEFIPAIGTYLGAAIPVLITVGLQGLIPALILVGWTIVYQQVENYWLSPRLSAHTMEINGGVAFGSALAGGAIGGPMGAFMALPIAALVTSFLKNFSRSYPLVYQSPYDDPEPEGDDAEVGEAAGGVGGPGRAKDRGPDLSTPEVTTQLDAAHRVE